MSLPGGGAACRATITRTRDNPSSPSSSQPPSNTSTSSPLFLLVTLAVGLSSQRALDLGTLQEQIASPSRNARGTCQQKLSDDSPIAIGSVETDQPHLWWESKGLQICRDS